MLHEEELTKAIIGSAIEVHRTIGSGLLESAYQKCVGHQFDLDGIPYRKELELPVVYKGVTAETGYRLDFLVADRVIIEIKACTDISDIHRAQLLTYLRLSNKRVGLIFNFHATRLMSRSGYARIVN